MLVAVKTELIPLMDAIQIYIADLELPSSVINQLILNFRCFLRSGALKIKSYSYLINWYSFIFPFINVL